MALEVEMKMVKISERKARLDIVAIFVMIEKVMCNKVLMGEGKCLNG